MTQSPQIPSKPVNRPADVLVQKSEARMGAMALLSRTQVKLWKAMLVTFFVTGFFGAMLFAVGLQIGNKSNAAGIASQAKNLVPISSLSSPVFCRPGECIPDFKKNKKMSVRQFGSPYIDIEFPGYQEYTVSKLVLAVDLNDKNKQSFPKEFHVDHSRDCRSYVRTMRGVKDSSSASQHYVMPPNIKARCIRLYIDSNYGDPVWTTLSGIEVWGF